MAKELQLIQNSTKSIKQLRLEMQQAQLAVQNFSGTTEEFNDVMKRLEKTQDELSTAMAERRGGVADMDNSYNALQNRLTAVNKAWRQLDPSKFANEIKRLKEEALDLQVKLARQDQQVGSFYRNVGNYGQVLGNLTKFNQQWVSSFSTLTPVMNTFGISVNDDSKALNAFNAAMALMMSAQGVAGAITAIPMLIASVKNLTIAQKVLNVVMAANPLGAVLRVVMLLATAIGGLVLAWKNFGTQARETAKAQAEAKEASEHLNKELDKQSNLLKNKNANAYHYYIEALRKANGNVKAITEAEEAYNKALDDNRKLVYATKKAELEGAIAKNKEAARKTKDTEEQKKYNDEVARLIQLLNDLKAENNNAIGKGIEASAELAKKKAEDVAKAAEEARQAQENDLIRLAEKEAEYEEAEDIAYTNRYTKEEYWNQRRLELQDAFYKDSIQMASDNAKAEEDIYLKSEQTKKRIDALKRKREESAMNATESILGSTADIVGKDSAAGKALAVSQAVIHTYSASNKALDAGGGIPWGLAPMIATIVAGIANVKSILSTDATGTTNIPGATSAPSVSTSPIEYTRNILTDSENELLNSPTKVYVLESDISQAQNKVKVAENASSF